MATREEILQKYGLGQSKADIAESFLAKQPKAPQSIPSPFQSPFQSQSTTQTTTPTSVKRSPFQDVVGLGKATGSLLKDTLRAIPQVHKQKEPFQSGILQAAGALETTASQIAKHIGTRKSPLIESQTVLQKGLVELSDFLAKMSANDLAGAATLAENVSLASGKDRPENIARGIAQNAPNLLGGFLVGTAGAVAGGVTGATVATLGYASALEGGFAFNEAKQFGATDEQAQEIMVKVGIANGILETLPISRAFSRIPLGKQFRKQLLSNVARAIVQNGIEESGTEFIQEAVTNAALAMVDENRTLFQNAPEAAFFGGLLGLGTGVTTQVGGGGLRGLEIEDVSGVPNELQPLAKEAKKFKTADEFVSQFELHGTNADIVGGKLKLKGKGGTFDSGGIFLTNEQQIADVFGKKTLRAFTKDLDLLDLTKNDGIDLVRSKIGSTYKTFDGEAVKFTKQDFDAVFPQGKADFATISQYPEFFENLGFDGLKFKEFAGGKTGTTFQLYKEEVPIFTKSQLTDIWNKVKGEKTKRAPSPQRLLAEEKPRKVTRTEDVLLRERIRAEKRGATRAVKQLKTQTKDRRGLLNAIASQFVLTDAEMRTIRRGRDFTRMTDKEFDTYLGEVYFGAQQINDLTEARTQLKGTIFEKELTKTENLRKALGFPTVNNMSLAQLEEFDSILQQYKTGDEFLGVRQIETVDKTDLKGIRTLREARERLAEETNVSVEELNNIKVGELDRLRYDTSLADRNAFYKMMVDETNKAMLQGESRLIETREKVNDLIKSARASKKRTVGERLVPTDKAIFEYLESNDITKQELQKTMTPEEVKAAEFIREKYAEMRDYLVQHHTLEKYRENYITHIRRGFLEAWKDDGLLKAFKGVFQQYQEDEAVFQILDADTGNILPLEKFFQFSMRRSGELTPTKNVASAFLAYLGSFEKKAALDSLVPKLDIYAHSLTPKEMTNRGLVMDRSLKTFVNEWVNNKKGRRNNVGFIRQGSKIDIALRGIKMFTTILDLGLNIPVSIASQFGEQATTFTLLGTKPYAKGIRRLATKKGQRIVKTNENFVGRTPWDAITDATNDVGDVLAQGMFALFRDGTTRANKIYLLGSLTDTEWKSEILSPARLANLKREMGRYRVTENASSVIGSTSSGKLFTQYKTWAIPIIRTTIDNINKAQKMLRSDGPTAALQSREFHELFRSIVVMGIIGLIALSLFDEDDKDDSFTKTVIQKIYRDAMSTIGALNPKLVTGEPRVIAFLADLGTALDELLRLEEYKAGGLKGPAKLQRLITPRAIKQFLPKSNTSGGIQTRQQILSKYGVGGTSAREQILNKYGL